MEETITSFDVMDEVYSFLVEKFVVQEVQFEDVPTARQAWFDEGSGHSSSIYGAYDKAHLIKTGSKYWMIARDCNGRDIVVFDVGPSERHSIHRKFEGDLPYLREVFRDKMEQLQHHLEASILHNVNRYSALDCSSGTYEGQAPFSNMNGYLTNIERGPGRSGYTREGVEKLKKFVEQSLSFEIRKTKEVPATPVS